jgi:O-antigen ligase
VTAVIASISAAHLSEHLGAIADVLFAAAVLCLPTTARWRRPRAAAMAAALVLTPVLLASVEWQRLHSLRRHPLYAVIAILAGLALIAALSKLFDRRPAAFPLAALAALPFRIPLGTIANGGLLLPLYLVIGAAALQHLARTLRPDASVDAAATEAQTPALLERSLALVIVLYAVQASYSLDFSKALEQITFFYVPFALLFHLLARVRFDAVLLRRALQLLVGLALLFVAVGLVESATHHLLLNRTLDANAYFVRINSLFYDPNIYGRFLALTMILVVAAMLWESRPRYVYAALVAVAAMWVGIVLAVSQSSIVAVLGGLAVIAAFYFGLRAATIASSAALVVVVLVVLVAGSSFHINLSNTHETNLSTSGRYSLVTQGIDMFAARPLDGYGSASFSNEYLIRVRNPHAKTSDSHSIPVTIAAEQGVIGLLAYLLLLAACFRRLLARGLRRATSDGETIARIAIAAAFFGLVLHTFLYADFLEDPSTWALLAVGSALAWAHARRPAAATPSR